jgi:hypothetical protein
MATAAISMEKMLITPPLTLGEKDIRKPITPKKIAIRARINPVNAPMKMLAIAQPSAMSEGMLKCGLVCVVSIKETDTFAFAAN